MDFVELNLLGSDYKQVTGSCKESIDQQNAGIAGRNEQPLS